MQIKSAKAQILGVEERVVGSNRCVIIWDADDIDAEQAVAELFARGELDPDDRIVCLPTPVSTRLQ